MEHHQVGGHSNPNSVISPQFCHPHPTEITVARKFSSLRNNRYEVIDANGSTIFTIPRHRLSPKERKFIDPSSGQTAVNCCRVGYFRHGVWQVFRGESTDPRDLTFRTTVELSSLTKKNNKLRIYLANNTSQSEEACDYLLKASSFMSSGEVYAGGSSNGVIAQFSKKMALFGRDKFVVSVDSNVDYMFIASIIVILDEINVKRD